jgi:alkylated DNA repair dioxygenase AlkB
LPRSQANAVNDSNINRVVAELPAGFSYYPEFLDGKEQAEVIGTIERLGFEPFRFQGYTAKREIVVYGWDYDFTSRKASETESLPEFLHPLRAKVASYLREREQDFVEALVTKYPSGAQIGWHRDVPQFEIVAGISLLSPCRMRLKPYPAKGRATIFSVVLTPGSLYVMRDDARWKFQHSIPPVEELRYSVTLRTLRKKPAHGLSKTSSAEVAPKP